MSDEYFDWQCSKAKPLTKELKTRLVELGVAKFDVNWSGGCDEGMGDVSVYYKKESVVEVARQKGYQSDPAYDLIYDWAVGKGWYSGAGDGTDYGDSYHYDLDKGTVSHTDWYHEQRTNDNGVVDRI